jgi:outer membrane receptor protein involved in Fe transport
LTLDEEFLPNRIKLKIDEDNVAWRVGADWQVQDLSMLYAYVSRGYKAGAFPAVGASTIAQLYPIKQESILAYEAGFKLSLGSGTAQLNGAVYHYDYDGKQILGFVIDPIQGALNTLVSIPKSKVDGAELELTIEPIAGLNVKVSGTYTDARVAGSFINPDAFGTSFQFDGSTLPRVPKWAADLDAQYDWLLTDTLSAFVGGHLNYADKQSAAFASPADPRSAVFFDPSRTLIDLRAGVQTDSWRVMAWGRNVTDEYYYSVYSVLDTIDHMAGRPVTYGVDVSFSFR